MLLDIMIVEISSEAIKGTIINNNPAIRISKNRFKIEISSL
jgi:hypothetical protein